MRKRLLSLLLTAAMCLTLTPYAALAEDDAALPAQQESAEIPDAQGTQGDAEQADENQEEISEEKPGENPEESQEEKQEESADENSADAAALAAQELIDALPAADALPALGDDETLAAYAAALAAYDAYDALTAEQQAQIVGAARMLELLEWFNAQTATQEGETQEGETPTTVAEVNGTTYADMTTAIKEWMANGGTLKLYANASTDHEFSSAKGQSFTIDLNGFQFSYNANKLGSKSLTIMDLGENGGGTFGPLEADSSSGTLTLESGYLQGLDVPSSAEPTIFLKGGKVEGIVCPHPVYTLLPNGYCLMDSNDQPVDPAKPLDDKTGTYTVENPQPQVVSSVQTGSSTKNKPTIPFALSLAADGGNVEQMQFSWYLVGKVVGIDGNGEEKVENMYPLATEALLAESGNVKAANNRYTYDTSTQGNAANWKDLEVDKTYVLTCVVTGMDSAGNKLWQTPLKNYRLTIDPTDLKDLELTFKQVGESWSGLNLKGNIRDSDGTFVFEPYGGDANSAASLSYLFEVYNGEQKLTEGTDYTIVDNSNQAKYAGDHTLTIQGTGDYTGTATHTWRIEPYTLTKGNYNPPTIEKEYDGTTDFAFSAFGGWGSFTENVANRPNDAGTGKNPSLGADESAISIYLTPDDFEASPVTLDSPDVGDRTASFTITLKTRDGQTEPNFVFEDDASPVIQVTGAAASITKANAPQNLASGKLTIYNGTAKTYEIDIASLLPKLAGNCKYGEIKDTETIGYTEYRTEIKDITLDSSYYDANANGAKIKNGKLILPILNANTTATGSIGTIQLQVVSQNYQPFDWTINVSAANQPATSGSSGGGHSGGYGNPSKPSGSTTTGTTTGEDGTTTKTETKPDGTVTETVTKPDGTETVTETKPDGTVTETVSTPDGSQTTTETKPDGSSTTETTKPDGSTGLVTVDVNGKTEARAAISNDTIADAKNNGTTIELPIEVKSGKDSNSAPAVNIDLGAPTGTDVSVEIPVSNVTPGTVAILVHEDGTEEILKSSRTTDNGVQIRMDGSATVKIVDNSKDFSDTRDHWSKDSVDFVTSRGLFSGVGKDQFGVGSPMTRGMVNTVLARLAGVDTTPAPGQQWYEVGMQWAKDNGISDGTNPLGNVTREQFAALLYRFNGAPEVSGSLTFRDANDISSYAEDAMLWAVQNGIISGVGDERVAPKANANREQVAAMMERYLKNL